MLNLSGSVLFRMHFREEHQINEENEIASHRLDLHPDLDDRSWWWEPLRQFEILDGIRRRRSLISAQGSSIRENPGT